MDIFKIWRIIVIERSFNLSFLNAWKIIITIIKVKIGQITIINLINALEYVKRKQNGYLITSL